MFDHRDESPRPPTLVMLRSVLASRAIAYREFGSAGASRSARDGYRAARRGIAVWCQDATGTRRFVTF